MKETEREKQTEIVRKVMSLAVEDAIDLFGKTGDDINPMGLDFELTHHGWTVKISIAPLSADRGG